MIYLLSFFVSLVYICVGIVVAHIGGFLKEKNAIEKISFSFGIGIGILSVQMFLYTVFHIKWNIIFILLPWVIIFLLYFRKIKISFNQKSILNNFSFNKIETVFIVILLILLLYSLFEIPLRPVIAWDGWANWFLGGKAFYINKSINPAFIKYADNSSPPLIYCMIALSYFLIGGLNEYVALFQFGGFFIFTSIILFSEIKKRSNLKTAALFTILFVITPNILRHGVRYDLGNADLPLAYFLFCSFILMIDYLKKRRLSDLVLLNLFLGFGSWVKSEGIPFLIIVNAVIFLIGLKQRQYKSFITSIISIGIVLMWQVYKIHFLLPGNPFITHMPDLSRTLSILCAIGREFLNINRWNLLWVVFFLILMSAKKKTAIYIVIILLQLLVYFLVYMMTPWDPVIHIENSFDRLLIQIAPITFFSIFLLTPSIIRKRFFSEKNI